MNEIKLDDIEWKNENTIVLTNNLFLANYILTK